MLAWELAQGARQTWPRLLRHCYSAWLFVQCWALFVTFTSLSSSAEANRRLSLPELRALELSQRAEFLGGYLVLLLQQQLLLLALLIPALTAGSLGQEKERGTLFALFGTELTSWQIVLGKLLGRLALIAPLALTSLPPLVLVTVLTDLDLTRLLLALLQNAVLAFALGAACFLFAIWIRRAGDAILACYVLLSLGYLAARALFASLPVARWLDPASNLRNLFTGDSGGQLPPFLLHLAAWAGVGVVCLLLAAARLRRACLEQGQKSPSRRLWAYRPPVGDNPILWRERHVIGLAPLPFLRVVPRWLAVLGVFTFSAAVTVLVAESVAPGVVPAVLNFDFARAYADLRLEAGNIGSVMPVLGLIFIFLAEMLVGVRCLTSVAEEKRRKTWDDLLLTAQSFQEITRSKMWGVLLATVPYVIAYAVPVFALAYVGGIWMFLAASFWLILPCAAVFIGALMGMEMLRVPRDMDETRKGGAFYFERRRHQNDAEDWQNQWEDAPG